MVKPRVNIEENACMSSPKQPKYARYPKIKDKSIDPNPTGFISYKYALLNSITFGLKPILLLIDKSANKVPHQAIATIEYRFKTVDEIEYIS